MTWAASGICFVSSMIGSVAPRGSLAPDRRVQVTARVAASTPTTTARRRSWSSLRRWTIVRQPNHVAWTSAAATSQTTPSVCVSTSNVADRPSATAVQREVAATRDSECREAHRSSAAERCSPFGATTTDAKATAGVTARRAATGCHRSPAERITMLSAQASTNAHRRAERSRMAITAAAPSSSHEAGARAA